MTAYDRILSELKTSPRRWLVTGAAGFIGSNLVEALLAANQTVIGFDCFSTGKQVNLPKVSALSAASSHKRFTFIEGDIRSIDSCRAACQDVDYILHQAAQVSVPASMTNPVETHEANVTGFLNVLMAARIRKSPGAAERARAKEMLARVGLAERAHHLPMQLSGGERQRVAVARALINSPKLLLADEPTGNLDEHTGDAVIELLLTLCRETGTALVLVTHNVAHAQKANRSLFLHDGVLR